MKVNNRLIHRSKFVWIAGLIALAIVIGAGLRHAVLHQRQIEVAMRGAQVMPFDLEKTTHHFESLPDGGLQTVVADAPIDPEQVKLIQSHLEEETAKFQAGDFSDPAAIHGDTMPGLKQLRTGYRDMTVEYTALSDGGQIRYTTEQPTLVTAVHDWFSAQRSDHGHHAE